MASSELTRKVLFGNGSSHNGTGRRNFPPAMPEGFEAVNDILRIVSISCYVLIFVLSVLGNSAIIAIIFKNKNMRTKANVMIVNMAVSDLFVTIIGLPRSIDVSVTRSYRWKLPAIIAEAVCKLSPFLREVSCAASAFSMIGIALDRFYAIVVPLADKPSVLKLKFLIAIIWFTSTASNALFLYSYKVVSISHAGKFNLKCHNTLNIYQKKVFYVFRFTAFIVVPLATLAALYVIIISKMSSRNIPGANCTEDFTKVRRKQNRNIVKLSVAIVVSFAVCWLPFYIGLLVHAFLWEFRLPEPKSLVIPIHALDTIFTILTYTSLAINPYICLIFSSNFRRSARTLIALKTSVRHPITRVTTAADPGIPRVLSMSKLDISLDNLSVDRHQEREEACQRPPDPNEIVEDCIRSLNNSPGNKKNTPSDQYNEKTVNSIKDSNIPTPAESSGLHKNCIEKNCSSNGETHLNKGFQLNENNLLTEGYKLSYQ